MYVFGVCKFELITNFVPQVLPTTVLGVHNAVLSVIKIFCCPNSMQILMTRAKISQFVQHYVFMECLSAYVHIYIMSWIYVYVYAY